MEFAGTDRFSLLAKLGEGGMGIVYEAHDRSRDMRVALKTLRHARPAHLYRFKREFRALSALSHPNIVRLYDLLSEAGHWFFTMELVEGKDVLAHVRAGLPGPSWQKTGAVWPGEAPGPWSSGAHAISMDGLETRTSELALIAGQDHEPPHGTDGVSPDVPGHVPGAPMRHVVAQPIAQPLGQPPGTDDIDAVDDIVDVAELRRVLIQLAGALDALHAAGLVHRDLKPSNVRVTAEGRVVLMDFGIVAELGRRELHESGAAGPAMIMGTPSYMAPEQVDSDEATAATDWYAFGVLLYQALCGRLPHEGTVIEILRAKKQRLPEPPSTLATGVPDDLERLCMALLAHDPARRPRGAEVLAALGATGHRPDAAHAPAAQEAHAGSASVFVGRTAELDRLHAVYAASRAQGMQCAVVRGPSGMGKTRLIEHFLDQLCRQPGPPVVLAGRCHERESLPYKAFDGVIDSLCQHLLGLDEDRRGALLPDGVEALARLFPVLLQVVPDRALAALAGRDPRDLRARAMDALRALLAALAGNGPAILYIEDLQWADADSLELLLYLLRGPALAGLLLVVTVRSECASSAQVAAAMDALADRDLCHFIEVKPLSEDEQRELLMRLSRRRDVHALFDDRLRAESAGHPMLLVELSRYLDEVKTPLAAQQALRLEDVIWRRISLLPGPARALVEVIAVAGEPLPLGVLAAAAGLSGTEGERAAATLCTAHLARVARTADQPWLDGFHIKVSEAVMERLPAESIRFVHVQLAHALEAWVDAPVATMAHHWLAAGDSQQAALYLIEAARTAAHQLAFDRAAELYSAGLELLPEHAGSPRLDLARCRAWIGMAEALRVADREDEALALLDRAEDMAVDYQWAEELANLHYLRGALLFPRGDLRGCLAAHERAYSFAVMARSAQGEAHALSGLGDASYMRGRMLAAHVYFDRCIGVCREHGFASIEAANLSMRGLTHYFQNDLERALRDGLAAAAQAARIGHQRAEMVARSTCIGWVLIEMGHLDQARLEYEQALSLLCALGASRFEALCLASLARIAVLADQRDQARALACRAVASSRVGGPAFAGAMALGALALATDDAVERGHALARAEGILRRGAVGHNHLHFYRDAIDACLRGGQLELAERYAARLEQYTRAEPLPWSHFLIERARALIEHLRGQQNGDRLLRLCDQARHAGLHTALRALDEATERCYEQQPVIAPRS